MKNKKEILAALARTDEERIAIAGLLDQEQTCTQRGYLTATKFLNLNERALCGEAVRLAGASAHAVFCGGYEQAERGVYVFYPDYMDAESAREAAPLALLRAHKHPGDTLAHRDYLGALMGLQIDRSVIGDILVHDDGADLIVLEDMADFILLNFGKAGRKHLTMTREVLSDLHFAATVEKEGEGSVASPRLDSVLALVFNLSRSEAQMHIEKGLVFVNNAPCQKAERQVDEGDRLTVRGSGRARIVSFGGVSRKGRVFVKFTKTSG